MVANKGSARKSTAFTSIDFDRPGKQVGQIMFPHSPNDDAWGARVGCR